jgi:hypothetical protein
MFMVSFHTFFENTGFCEVLLAGLEGDTKDKLKGEIINDKKKGKMGT